MASPGGLSESVLARAEFPDTPLVVALSGGADSAVLLWAATRSSTAVRAVFVDHELAESSRLGRAAADIAAKLDVPFDLVPAPVDPAAPSLEERARDARYAALRETAKPGESIATGHTSDDQAETVIGNLLRGAGTRGLAGIPRSRGRVVRPLLSVSRSETRELAAQLQLPFVDDPANVEPRHRRNRIRHQLLPQLERDFNPGLRDALVRTARIVAADHAALEARSDQVPVMQDEEAVFIPAAILYMTDPAVAARAVRRAIRLIRGPHRGLHDEAMVVLEVAARVRRSGEIGSGIRVDREGPFVVLHGPGPDPHPAVEAPLPGVVRFDRWELELRRRPTPPRPRPLGRRSALIGAAAVEGATFRLEPGCTDGTLDLGDGSKQVRDALADAGVPRRLRNRWPVLWSGDRVAWVPGARVADWARAARDEGTVVADLRSV